MSDSTQPMESPSGLELHPDPPPTARISKKVGVAVLGVVVVVGVLVVYGLYARREQQQVAQAMNEEKHPESARSSRRSIGKGVGSARRCKSSSGIFWARQGDRSWASKWWQRKCRIQVLCNLLGSCIATMGRRVGQKPVGRVTEVMLQPADLRNYRRKRSCAWRHSVRNRKRLPRPLPCAEAVRCRVRPQQGRPMTPCNKSGRSPRSWELERDRGSRIVLQTVWFLRVRGPKRAVTMTCRTNKRANKRFIEQTRGRAVNNYLKSTRTPPLGKYEVKMGWDIPAILEQGINSDLPGEVKALVRSNVYDTATGKYLLIPQGSRMVGVYDSQIAYGQNRLQVIWSRIIYPDGSSINLDGMMGQDIQGMAGFHDKVDNHYKRLVGSALLTSAFTAGIELSQRQNTSLLTTPTAGQTASSAVGQQLGELGSEITRKNLNIPPTHQDSCRLPVQCPRESGHPLRSTLHSC